MTPGERFTRLVTVSDASVPRRNQWLCRCDCGGEKVFLASVLRRGQAKSCGCINRRVDGASAHPLYSTFKGMHHRCDPATGDPNYGSRGIRVCVRWSTDDGFDNFVADMGQRPSGRHSLDRIDNNGPYSPENCRWATATEQANNQRTNIRITIDGETLTLSQWAQRQGVSRSVIWERLKRGWPRDVAVVAPLNGAPGRGVPPFWRIRAKKKRRQVRGLAPDA